MRFLHLSTAYSVYLDKLYAERPELAGAAYEEQREAIHGDAFGWADFWSHYLGERGFVAEDRLTNAKPAQLAWARDRGIDVASEGWLPQIAAEQVRQFAPEVLFIEDYAVFPARWIAELRERVRSIRLVIGWCGAPYRDASFFGACDLVLSCVPELVEKIRALGHRSELLRHGFDARILRRLGEPAAQHRFPVTFVGNVGSGSAAHDERLSLLARIAGQFDLTVFTPAADRSAWQRLRAAAKVALGRDRAPPAALRRVMRPSVFGLAMFRTLRASAVTLNSHIAISARSASNMRLYEATGSGTCLVTDWKPDLHRHFAIDSEVVAYRSADECAEKVGYLLANAAARDEIAAAGQARTLREHGFDRRAADLEALIRRHLP